MNKKGFIKVLPFVIMGAVILIISLIFFFPAILPTQKKSAENEYVVNGYDVNVTVLENNVLSITERIDVEFFLQSHGIFRQIPIYQTIQFEHENKQITKRYKIQINSIISSHAYDCYESGNNFVIQIGNPNSFADTNETYEISYKINLGDDKLTSFDHLYYNFIGNQWDTTISNIKININFNKPIENNEIYFYIGTPEGDLVETREIVDSAVSFSYSGTLMPFYGLSGRTVLPQGYFTTEKQSNTVDIILLVCSIVALIIGLILFFLKNSKNKIIPIVEFTPPEGITPSDAGFIIDKQVNKGDVSALIVYWASKGFLKIEDHGEDTKLTKLKDADKSFKVYEKEVFDSLFNSSEKQTVSLNEKNERLTTSVLAAKEGIKFENEKYFSSAASALKYLLISVFAIVVAISYYFIGQKVGIGFYSVFVCILIGLLLFATGYILIYSQERKLTMKKFNYYFAQVFSYIIFLSIYITSAIFLTESYSNPLLISIFVPLNMFSLVVLALNINDKIEGEKKEVGRVFGLRNFILHVEKDRIKVLAEDNPELFYEILPYAYVLGINHVWIEKFSEIEVAPPNWYVGNGNLLQTYISLRLINSINVLNKTVTRSMVKANPGGNVGKGSGGFGGGFGGGHSGGGFGGGGGGRW